MGRSADKAEIKKAYFKLAKLYHPDTNKVCVPVFGLAAVFVDWRLLCDCYGSENSKMY